MNEIDWYDESREHEMMGRPDPYDLPDDGAEGDDSPRLVELFAEANAKATRRAREFDARRRDERRRLEEAAREKATPVTANRLYTLIDQLSRSRNKDLATRSAHWRALVTEAFLTHDGSCRRAPLSALRQDLMLFKPRPRLTGEDSRRYGLLHQRVIRLDSTLKRR